MSIEIDLVALKAVAEAAGGDHWSDDVEDLAVPGTFDGHYVWRDDGDAVARCFPYTGNVVLGPVDDGDVAAFIAAANPAVVLALIERLQEAERNLDVAFQVIGLHA